MSTAYLYIRVGFFKGESFPDLAPTGQIQGVWERSQRIPPVAREGTCLSKTGL